MKKISRRSFVPYRCRCLPAAVALSACALLLQAPPPFPPLPVPPKRARSRRPCYPAVVSVDKESTLLARPWPTATASHKDVTIEMVDLGSSDYMTVLATQPAALIWIS